MKKSKGFTLIELMIVVAIIGILSAIAIPKFADLIRKSNEGATKGNLGALRSALSIYYGEMEGWFPAASPGGALTMQNGKYIKEIPDCYTPNYHSKSNSFNVDAASADETAGTPGIWGYRDETAPTTGKSWGDLWVNCTHTDSKSTSWGSY
ncbi:MAG: type II secretion system protein [Endomicrobiales bacterium]|nr:type II secretion system protein [Endomicrobiales bacterium]